MGCSCHCPPGRGRPESQGARRALGQLGANTTRSLRGALGTRVRLRRGLASPPALPGPSPPPAVPLPSVPEPTAGCWGGRGRGAAEQPGRGRNGRNGGKRMGRSILWANREWKCFPNTHTRMQTHVCTHKHTRVCAHVPGAASPAHTVDETRCSLQVISF